MSEEKINELEKEFQEIADAHRKEYQKKYKAFEDALADLEEFSERTMMPISVAVDSVYNSYIPESFTKKFEDKISEIEDDDDDLIRECFYSAFDTGMGEYGLSSGWQQSMC